MWISAWHKNLDFKLTLFFCVEIDSKGHMKWELERCHITTLMRCENLWKFYLFTITGWCQVIEIKGENSWNVTSMRNDKHSVI